MADCFLPVAASSSVAVIFVASVRLVSWDDKNRDATRTILKRASGAAFACIYGLLLAAVWRLSDLSLSAQLGFKWDGLKVALIAPLFLSVVLFLGPIVLQLVDGTASAFMTIQFWRLCFTDARWYRNQILAPLSEEFAFNACALPLLLHCFSPVKALFSAPIAFSLAHFHHIPDLMRRGFTAPEALTSCAFQAGYTYVFGVYSSFIFVRTGHIVASILCHSFCNHMGFPAFEQISEYDGWRRWLLWISFIAGVLGWIFLLFPLTDPSMYGGSQYLRYHAQ